MERSVECTDCPFLSVGFYMSRGEVVSPTGVQERATEAYMDLWRQSAPFGLGSTHAILRGLYER